MTRVRGDIPDRWAHWGDDRDRGGCPIRVARIAVLAAALVWAVTR